MTFLNPLVLFGLAAAAIPVVLHLLQRRRLRTIEFSTLRFLKEIEQSALRRLMLRQWLLLLVRTLLIISLVLAFAQPVLKGGLPGSSGIRSASAVVILLDDSPSMGIRNERGLLFDQAREAAGTIVGASGEADRIAIIPLSSTRAGTGSTGFRSRGGAEILLPELRPSEVRGSIHRGLNAAVGLLDSAQEANRELYLLTDGQGTQFAPDTSNPLLPPSTPHQLMIVRIPAGEKGNVGVTAARTLTRIRSAGHSIQLAVTLRNFGEVPASGMPLHVYLDGVRVAQQTAELPPRASTDLIIPLLPRRSGVLRGSLQIEEDGLDLDNLRPFLLPIPAAPRVLVVGTDPAFPILALRAGGDSLAAGSMRLRQIRGADLSTADLRGTDVLLVAGINQLTPVQGSVILNFLRRGGGVVLFPGRDLDPLSYRSNLWEGAGVSGWRPADAALLPPARLRDGFSIASFARLDVAHPLLAGLFATERPAQGSALVESPQIFRTAGLRADPRGNALITLTNGEVFLGEFRVGSGSLLVFGVEGGISWSDFPLKGIFAPLLHRCVAYLISPADEAPAETGDPLRFSLPHGRTPERNRLLLRSPDGTVERLQPAPSPSVEGREAIGSSALLAGIYTLSTASAEDTSLIAARAVVMPAEEGDLRPMSDRDLLKSAGADLRPEGYTSLITAGEIAKAIEERRIGTELWQVFVILAVCLAISEMILGRESGGEEQR